MASVRALVKNTYLAWRMVAGFDPLHPPTNNSLFRCPVDWEEYHASNARADGAYATDFFNLGQGLFLPAMFRESSDLTEVETVIIVVHGADRSSGWNLDGVAVGVNAIDDDGVAIVAPSFPDRPCTAADWISNSTGNANTMVDGNWTNDTNTSPDGNRTSEAKASKCAPVWARAGGWSSGYESDAHYECPQTISSYRAMDMVIDALPRRYPRLWQIVLVGFSAGGEFTQKWALLSPQGEGGRATSGVRLRIISGAPPEYAYLDSSRPDPNCNQRDGLNLRHTCEKFVDVHTMNWTYNGTNFTDGTCNGTWDAWPYGLACLQNSTRKRCSQVGAYTMQGLSANGSADHSALRSEGFRHHILRRFASKDFRLSAGIDDTKDCAVYKCSSKAAPMLQGTDRLQRALNFVAHLNLVLAPYNYTAVFSSFNAGHDSDYFYDTNVFRRWVFDGYVPGSIDVVAKVLCIAIFCLVAVALVISAAVRRRKRSAQQMPSASTAAAFATQEVLVSADDQC